MDKFVITGGTALRGEVETNGSKNSALATGTITVGAIINPPPTAPVITVPPVSQTVTAGATVIFSVTATGTAPLSYQWQKNSGTLSGATSASLTLNSVTTTAAGSYSVIVSNSAGSVTSTSATLTVNASPPTEHQPPEVQIEYPSDNAAFLAGANIVLVAHAAAHDGRITQVQFFAGTRFLGNATLASDGEHDSAQEALYHWVWPRVPAGKYVLRAVATDHAQAITTSAPIHITVRSRQARD